MSARMEMETATWDTEQLQREGSAMDRSTIEIESILRNMDERNLVAPLREARTVALGARREHDHAHPRNATRTPST